jgi:hypothetical protein
MAPEALGALVHQHPRLAPLWNDYQRAVTARDDLLWSDDMCMTNGAWDRAADLARRCYRDLQRAAEQIVAGVAA